MLNTNNLLDLTSVKLPPLNGNIEPINGIISQPDPTPNLTGISQEINAQTLTQYL